MASNMLTEITEEWQTSGSGPSTEEDKNVRMGRPTIAELNSVVPHTTLKNSFTSDTFDAISHATIIGKIVNVEYRSHLALYRISDSTGQGTVCFYMDQERNKQVKQELQESKLAVSKAKNQYSEEELNLFTKMLDTTAQFSNSQLKSLWEGQYLKAVGPIQIYEGKAQVHAWEVVQISDLEFEMLEKVRAKESMTRTKGWWQLQH